MLLISLFNEFMEKNYVTIQYQFQRTIELIMLLVHYIEPELKIG